MKKFIVIGLLFLLAGCAAPTTKVLVDFENIPIYPPPPAEAKLQFLRAISSSSDIKQPGKLDQFLFGSSLMELEIGIEKPYGIAVKHGKIYICDSMLPGLVIIDLENKDMRTFSPGGRGVLRKPINVAVDNNGDIYVTDTERQQVVVYDKDLKYKYALTSDSWKPIDLIFYGDSLLVTDYEDRVVEVWSKSRKQPIGEFPPHNLDLPDSQRVFVPYSIAIGNNGNIYITDFGQFRVNEFDHRGRYIKSVGGIGRNLGKFARPKGIAVDKDGVLYVVDSAFENVQMFNREGQLLMFFGGPYQGPGDMYLPAQITIDTTSLDYFSDYVLSGYRLTELLAVTNQYGPDKITFYGKIEVDSTQMDALPLLPTPTKKESTENGENE